MGERLFATLLVIIHYIKQHEHFPEWLRDASINDISVEIDRLNILRFKCLKHGSISLVLEKSLELPLIWLNGAYQKFPRLCTDLELGRSIKHFLLDLYLSVS